MQAVKSKISPARSVYVTHGGYSHIAMLNMVVSVVLSAPVPVVTRSYFRKTFVLACAAGPVPVSERFRLRVGPGRSHARHVTIATLQVTVIMECHELEASFSCDTCDRQRRARHRKHRQRGSAFLKSADG